MDERQQADAALAAAIERTDEVLRGVWEREVAPAERVRAYSVGFECAESVGDRILSFIAGQPTWRRTYRTYEVGSKGGNDG